MFEKSDEQFEVELWQQKILFRKLTKKVENIDFLRMFQKIAQDRFIIRLSLIQ